MSRIHSVMPYLGSISVELLAELADELAFRPGEALVVDGDGQDALLAPAIALDLIGATPLAAIAAGKETHRGRAGHSRSLANRRCFPSRLAVMELPPLVAGN
jgi:hypothetical protein